CPTEAHDMHCVVRMKLPPAQHRRLEKIELAFHGYRAPAPWAACAAILERTSRCASRHQCFLIENQISAACSRFVVSISGSVWAKVAAASGVYASIHARVTAFVARWSVRGSPMWL